MFIKKIPIFFLLLLSFFSANFAASEIYLDYNNYCAGLETTYQLWNKTQWELRDEIDKEDIDYITNADIRIHNGPLEGMELLFEGSPNATGEFKVTYPESNQYLTFIETKGEGNFTNFEERIFIEDCKFVGNSDSLGENNQSLENISFTYEFIEFEVFETNITQEDIEITNRNENEFETTNLPENVLSIYEIGLGVDETYSTLGITFKPNTQNPFSIYSFDSSADQWRVVEENLDSEYFLSNAQTGIYAITNYEEVLEEPGTNTNSQNSNEEVLGEENNQNTPLPQVTQESGNNLGYIIIGVIIGLFVIASPFLFKSKKKKIDDHIISESLSSYSQEYEKTKQYVLQYKNQFDQKAIRQALVEGDVPIDIVDKVLQEVYL